MWVTFLFFFKINLLIYLAASGLSCSTRAPHCSTLVSLVALCRLLFSCGARAPEHTGSAVAVQGFSCPAACGIFVLGPGIELAYPALEGVFLTTGPPGKSQGYFSKADCSSYLESIYREQITLRKENCGLATE